MGCNFIEKFGFYDIIFIMHRFFIEDKLTVGNEAMIEGQEHLHLSNVLRQRVGSQIELICGDGNFYLSEIVEIGKKQTIVNVISKRKDNGGLNVPISVFMGLIRAEKMDLVVQKLTELGVSELVPFVSAFNTAKASTNKRDRCLRISKEACKQCGRADVMEIGECIDFKQLLTRLAEFDLVLFAYENAKRLLSATLKELKPKKVCIIIGSEGGFSETEVNVLDKAGAKVISLGKRVLRAETAAITAVSAVEVLLGEF